MSTGPNRAKPRASGFTLAEILVAIIITGIIVVAIGDLDLTRGKIQQRQEVLDHLQRQAHLAMQRVEKSVHGAYHIWYTTVDPENPPAQNPQPRYVWLQHLNDSAVPNNRAPDLDVFDDPDNYTYSLYALDPDTRRLLFRQNYCPGSVTPIPGGAAPKDVVVATNVVSFAILQRQEFEREGGGPPGPGRPINPSNVYEVWLSTATDDWPEDERRSEVNMILANRQTARELPLGWAPPCPDACLGRGLCD